MLKRTLLSIRAQTYQNFEVIIIDDGLEQRAEHIVSEIADDRFRYFKNEKNLGNAASKNRALKHARGDFITALDDDDEWLPERLETFQKIFKDVPEAGVVYCGARAYDEEGMLVRERMPRHDGLVDKHVQYRELLERARIYTGTWTVRREAAGDELYFDEDYRKNQDWDFLIRLARQCRFYAIPDVLVRLSVGRGDHMEGGIHGKRHLEGLELILKKHHEGLKENRDVWARRLFETGLAYARLQRKEQAREKFKHAWRLRPWNPRYIKRLVSTS